MKIPLATGLASSALLVVSAAARQAKPAAFFLAGDSTTATDGGWGDGFVALLRNGAVGQNRGHSGATTASFVAGGDWAAVLDLVGRHTAAYDCYVTIQFGHNDQKPAAGISMPQFQANLEAMARDVQRAGGTPVLLTSLTRRTFAADGVLEDSLADVSEAARRAAAAVPGAALLDLNAASRAYVQAIGPAAADGYNLAPGDRTHLNPRGEAVFARVVADLLVGWRPALAEHVTPDPVMSGKIARGEVV
ncbi:hypothetical protein VTH06DRAFT_4947 [Thermothelomyces fergusii]